MGRVCAKHEQFYETECRWCETQTGLHATVPNPAAFFGINNPPGLHTFLFNGATHGHTGTVTTAGWMVLTTAGWRTD